MVEPALRNFDRGVMLGLFTCLAALAARRDGRLAKRNA
jgi:hypothetical protein